jgi:hypothetical protein
MIDLVNVINISVSTPQIGLGAFNVNNVALFTNDPFLVNASSDTWRAYVSPSQVGTDFGTSTETYQQANALFSQNPNILAGGGNLIVIPFLYAEDLPTAITRMKDVVYFCGIISTAYGASASWAATAVIVQALGNRILFLPSNASADIAGAFTTIKNATSYYTRCLYYGGTALQARLYAAAYAGRMMCTNFNGSNTTLTANLKQLSGITPDETITQTIYNNAATAGVDLYISYAGVPAVVSNGANKYFDSVFNLIWFVATLKVAGFNALAQVSTKIPQTEPGMSLLKGIYRQVCMLAKTNGYIAPGSWTLAEWFGVQEDFYNNILQFGFYIYSAPITAQLAADRVARKAPLVQIALKEAGAVHSSTIIVNINA